MFVVLFNCWLNFKMLVIWSWKAGRKGEVRKDGCHLVSSEPVLCPSPQRHLLTLLSSQLLFCSLHSSGWFCASRLSPQPSSQAVHRDFQYLLGNDSFGDDYSQGPCGQQNEETGILVPVNSWSAGTFLLRILWFICLCQ